MDSRQRWRAVLERKAVDRAPCDIWATDEVFDALCRKLNCADRWEVFDKLQIDAPYTTEPEYTGPKLASDCNIWGVKFKRIDYGAGCYNETVYCPLADAKTAGDIKKHQWPCAEWLDYSGIKEELKKHSHRPIRAGYVEPFLIYSSMRGLERAMMDTIENLDLVEFAFDFIFDFATRQFKRILDATDGRVDIAVPSEDLGSQTGPLFSLETFRKLHKGRFRNYIELAHAAGVFVFFHSDGACRDFIADLVEIGVDILNPIQWRCPGMEREGLKKDFGGRLVFHGGVDNQQVLPFGSIDDVRREVIRCFETLGVGGGYICAPCHNIQPNTPIENILAMYETISENSSEPIYTRRYTQKEVKNGRQLVQE